MPTETVQKYGANIHDRKKSQLSLDLGGMFPKTSSNSSKVSWGVEQLSAAFSRHMEPGRKKKCSESDKEGKACKQMWFEEES